MKKLHQVEVGVEDAEHAALFDQSAYETATTSWQDTDGRRRAVLQQLGATEAHVQAFGIVNPTVEAVRDTEAELEHFEIEVQRLRQRLDELATEHGRRESTCAQASDRKKTRLSTGEAIGVSAALMMVILTE